MIYSRNNYCTCVKKMCLSVTLLLFKLREKTMQWSLNLFLATYQLRWCWFHWIRLGFDSLPQQLILFEPNLSYWTLELCIPRWLHWERGVAAKTPGTPVEILSPPAYPSLPRELYPNRKLPLKWFYNDSMTVLNKINIFFLFHNHGT